MLSSSGNDLVAINYPKGPGKQWKLNDAVALLDAPLADRDFQNGKSMFAATTCVRCHAMGSDGGGNVGPDLTNLGTRFSKKDMLESIIDPNKTVSDQYAATQIMLRNGTSIIGRVTNEDKMAYYVSQNPYAPESIVPTVPITPTFLLRVVCTKALTPGSITLTTGTGKVSFNCSSATDAAVLHATTMSFTSKSFTKLVAIS
jgi:putative heme-binding domain-containing protein